LEPEEEAVARAHWIDGAVSGMEREVNKKWGRRPFPRATDPIPEVVSGHCLTPSWHDLAWPEPDQPALLCIRPKHPGDDHDWTTPSAWCWAPVDGTRCTRPVDHPAGGHRYVPFDYADDCRIAPNGRRRGPAPAAANPCDRRPRS
jgi:hypothetical protein